MPSDAPTRPELAGLIAARFFDGRSSRPTACLLRLLPVAKNGVGLQIYESPLIDGAAPLRELAPDQIEWPDAGQTRIAVIRFADGSLAQTMEPARLAHTLRDAGYRAPGVHALARKLAGSWPALLAGVAACAAISLGVWLYGVPAASKVITHFMPTRWETALGSSTLEALDKTWLSPSKLDAARQAQITTDFEALIKKAATGQSAPRYRLLFRSMKRKPGKSDEAGSGANAFALPGGTLVMTDELVAVAEPGAVMGVLAHELGHVQHRHATRIAVESSLLGTAVALISGDPTSVIATVPVVLATLSFSRSHETDADCFALNMLARAGESPEPLARLLDTIAKQHGTGTAGMLSSHPATPERVQLLRDPAAAKKACGG